MAEETTKTNQEKAKEKKFKRLRTLETIFYTGGLIGMGGFLGGTLIDNETLSLVSGGAGVLCAGIGLYAKCRKYHLLNTGYNPDSPDSPDYMNEDIQSDNDQSNNYTSHRRSYKRKMRGS